MDMEEWVVYNPFGNPLNKIDTDEWAVYKSLWNPQWIGKI